MEGGKMARKQVGKLRNETEDKRPLLSSAYCLLLRMCVTYTSSSTAPQRNCVYADGGTLTN